MRRAGWRNDSLLRNKVHTGDAMTASILPANWAHFIQCEYLETFVRDGGATIKFCVPIEEEGRARAWNALDQMGRDLGFLVVRLDAGKTKVNAIDQLF